MPQERLQCQEGTEESLGWVHEGATMGHTVAQEWSAQPMVLENQWLSIREKKANHFIIADLAQKEMPSRQTHETKLEMGRYESTGGL